VPVWSASEQRRAADARQAEQAGQRSLTSSARIAAGSGALAGLAVSAWYYSRGFESAQPWILLAALTTIVVALGPAFHRPAWHRADLAAVAAIAIISLPLYALRVYTIPWQVNTDEITLMSVARDLLAAPGVDVFGISSYFGCPVAAFMFFGKIAHTMGGINLNNVRLVHGLLGIASVLATYSLFRSLSSGVRLSASAAIIMAANHSLIAYSRMAMWSDSAVLLEIVAIHCLVRGFRTQSWRSVFLAGIACGLGFYVYFPGRIAIVLCVATLAMSVLVHPRPRPFKRTLQDGAVLFAGWLLVVAPVLIATAGNRKADTQYQREQLLIYPEGRRAAEHWTATHSPGAAWIANIKLGLETFNAHVVDHGWLYPNFNHGFVDTLTGILIWIGFVACLIRVFGFVKLRKMKPNKASINDVSAPVVALTGFAVLYLALAFLVTKAPNYQRLLMILPFAGYLAASGLWSVVQLSTELPGNVLSFRSRQRIMDCAAGLSLALILVMNISILRDFTLAGRRNGHEVGSTGRMVFARRNESGHTWVLAADKQHPYYFWGEPWWWKGWLGFFAGANQPVIVIPPSKLDSSTFPKGATVFASRMTWIRYENEFRSDHSVMSVTSVVPDGRLLAIETGPKH
jgi:hypothetical protein